MLDRKIILASIQEREMELVAMLSQELTAVTELIDKCDEDKSGEAARPYKNMPVHASRVMWSRSLSDRLASPMADAQRMLSNIMHSEAGREVLERYRLVVARLEAFERKEIEVWLQHSGLTFVDKLKQPLLRRDLTSSGLRVNFDQDLKALLREAKYLNLINVDLPDSIRAILGKAEVYQQHEANLHMMVNDYNALLAAMNDVSSSLPCKTLHPNPRAQNSCT
jgi:hypothetical protein